MLDTMGGKFVVAHSSMTCIAEDSSSSRHGLDWGMSSALFPWKETCSGQWRLSAASCYALVHT